MASQDDALEPTRKPRRGLTIVAIVLTASGLALTFATAFIEHHHWASSVLVNLGTTLVLAAPLAWLGHWLSEQINSSRRDTERQISNVREEVGVVQNDFNKLREFTAKSIADLQDEYRSSLEKESQLKSQELKDLRSHPTLDILQRAIEDLTHREYPHPGVVFRYHDGRLFSRFDFDPWASGGVKVEVFERGDNSSLAAVEFGNLNSIADLYLTLNRDLALKNSIVEQEFRVEDFFGGMSDDIEAMDETKERYHSIDIGRLVVVPNDAWLITDRALVSRQENYPPIWFAHSSMDKGGWMYHMQQKSWVDYDELWEAMNWVQQLNLASAEWVDGPPPSLG